MNQQAYVAQVHSQLLHLDFNEQTVPADLPLTTAVGRQETWGKLLIGVAPLDLNDEAGRERLAAACAAWVRNLRTAERKACYLILVFPFSRSTSDELTAAVRGLRQDGSDREWGLVPWTADLDVELVDQHVGFPHVGAAVARALTEIPRGKVESAWRATKGPKIGNRPLLNLGQMPATRIVLGLTVVAYIWVLMNQGGGVDVLSSPDVRVLLKWGANSSVLVLGLGENWRLLTHVLLHGSPMHLLFNMYAFWNIGRHVELIYGSGRMLFIYTVAGVAGGIASTAFRPVPIFASVGASGAIFGLMGALAYFALSVRGRQVDWRAVLQPILLNLLFGFALKFVDNYAHVGGLVGGFIGGFLAGIPGERKPWRTAAMGLTVLVLAVLVIGGIQLPHIPLF